MLPETFTAARDSRWEHWIYHVNNVVAVNRWAESQKLLCLKVRLTGRAQIAFQQLKTADRTTFKKATKALHERFEPATRKHRYRVELQTRVKKTENNCVFHFFLILNVDIGLVRTICLHPVRSLQSSIRNPTFQI